MEGEEPPGLPGSESGEALSQRNIDGALHNSQGSHAVSALFLRAGRDYFRIVNKRHQDETGTTMNLIRNYRNWRRYRETVNELGRLSNRELSDIGFTRNEIRSAALKAI